MTTVLFHRDFRRPSGGHLKVWHYFGHVLSLPGYDALMRLSADSVWDETNPWWSCPERVVAPDAPCRADIGFLAGLDWLALPPATRQRPPWPVVNLVQHVRHAAPGDPRFDFLAHPAVRICVGPEVEQAILATGRVNGPVYTIPNALDDEVFEAGTRAAGRRDIDVVVVAVKQPALGRSIAEHLARPGRAVHLLDAPVGHPSFLRILARARVALLLPHRREGFYLPALEAMAVGALVVCPDCIGNRSFCRDGETCVSPAYEEPALVAAVDAALASPAAAGDRMRNAAMAEASGHHLAGERSAFREILSELG